MKYPGIMVLSIILLFTTAGATVWYVHPDSTMNCIQDCLDSCSAGDTVLVGPGTYVENIMWPITSGIDLISEYGPDTTIIDGDSSGVVFYVSGMIDTTAVIRGFTITRGYGAYVGGIFCDATSPIIEDNIITDNAGIWGGGVACHNPNAEPVIRNNSILQNHADSTGGGIMCYNFANPMILENTIDSNTAGWGGGIYCGTFCSPLIQGNNITSNYSLSYGGGIALYTGSSPTIIDNLISENVSAYHGGGIRCYNNSSPIIKHNIITLNTAANYAAINLTSNSSPQIDSCTIANNNYDGVCCWGASNPVIYHCNIYGHTSNAVWNSDPNVTIDAEYVWWGDSTGPWHVTQNPGGQGNGVSDYVDFDPWMMDSITWQTGIAETRITYPMNIMLQVNPNPFHSTTIIRYSILDAGYTIEELRSSNFEMRKPTLRIYDATGRLVKSLNHESCIMNRESVFQWDGRDDQNRILGSGVYFIKLSVDSYTETKKVLLVR